MDSEEFFYEIIYVDKGYSDSESDDESEPRVNNTKDNAKKITTAQIEILNLKMRGRSDGFTKGKIKLTEKSQALLEEWNELTSQLNTLGPPQHTTSKWRRIWTKMKSRKNKRSHSPVTHSENKFKCMCGV